MYDPTGSPPSYPGCGRAGIGGDRYRPGSYRLAAGAVTVLAAWNPVVNRLLPRRWYVPANLAVAAGLVTFARRAGVSWTALGLHCSTARAGLRVGLRTAGVVAAGIATGLGLPRTRRLFADHRYAGVSGAGIAHEALVRIPLGTVVLEETAFRGVLLGLFIPPLGPWRAAGASSVLFGAWHVLPTLDALDANALAGEPLPRAAAVSGAVLVTGLAGIGFCALRFRTGSVLGPAVVHLATNSLGVLATAVALDVVEER